MIQKPASFGRERIEYGDGFPVSHLSCNTHGQWLLLRRGTGHLPTPAIGIEQNLYGRLESRLIL